MSSLNNGYSNGKGSKYQRSQRGSYQRGAEDREEEEYDEVKRKVAVLKERNYDIQRRSEHLEREIEFYQTEIQNEARIQVEITEENSEIKKEIERLESVSKSIKLSIVNMKKNRVDQDYEIKKNLKLFEKLDSDYELAISKLRDMEYRAKFLTEENYKLRKLEEASDDGMSYGKQYN